MNAPWETAILKSFDHHGGYASLSQIYETIKSFIKLTPTQLRDTVYGGRPAYQHEIRSYVSNLRQSGDLTPISRGNYRLTPKGKARIS